MILVQVKLSKKMINTNNILIYLINNLDLQAYFNQYIYIPRTDEHST